MEAVREFVYSVLIVSVSGAIISMFAPENHRVSKYLNFLVSLVVTSVLLLPMSSVVGKLPQLSDFDIEFDTSTRELSVYTDTLLVEICKNIETELTEDLCERFDIKPSRIEVHSNGDVEDLLIVGIDIYYESSNRLLYSDTVKHIKSIMGDECEVKVMYEDTEQ